MNAPVLMLAAASLVPAMTGPVTADLQSRIMISLCSGASVPLELPAVPGKNGTACCQKGCHSGSSRKRLDRAQ